MGFIKEEYQFRLLHIPFFGQSFKQFRKHPEQETGIQFRILHQFHTIQNIHHALAVFVASHPVCHIQSRFAEEQVAALIFQRQQCTGNTAQRLGGDIAVIHRKFLFMFIYIADHCPEVFHIDQFQTFVIGNAEDDIHYAFLGRCQVKNTGQKVGAHIGNGDTHIDVPESYRIPFIGKRISDTEFIDSFFHAFVLFAGGTQTRNIPFCVAKEHRHPCIGEGFRHDLHGNGFTCTAGTGNQTMTIRHIQRQDNSVLICQTQINIVI